MIGKNIAIDMLENIERCLYSEKWKCNTLETITEYKKRLQISSNKKIKKTIQKQIEYRKFYRENVRKINKNK